MATVKARFPPVSPRSAERSSTFSDWPRDGFLRFAQGAIPIACHHLQPAHASSAAPFRRKPGATAIILERAVDRFVPQSVLSAVLKDQIAVRHGCGSRRSGRIRAPDPRANRGIRCTDFVCPPGDMPLGLCDQKKSTILVLMFVICEIVPSR